jgi:hypothetical protein
LRLNNEIKNKKKPKTKTSQAIFSRDEREKKQKKKKSSPLATNHTTMMTRITPTRKGHSGVSNNMMEEYF